MFKSFFCFCPNNGKFPNLVKVGDSHKTTRCFSLLDIERFSALSHDMNGIHLDIENARKCGFEKIIVPGMLTASVFSAIMGNHLPGPGSIYLSQTIQFRSPVHADDTVDYNVKIKRIFRQNGIFHMEMSAAVGNRLVLQGQAIGKNTILSSQCNQEGY